MALQGGGEWKEWRRNLHAWLLKTQENKGDQAGSWFVGRDHGTSSAGRLYCTTMAVMMLNARPQADAGKKKKD